MKLAPLCLRVNESFDVYEILSCRAHTEFEEQISLLKGHDEQLEITLEIENGIAALKEEIDEELKAIGGLQP